MGGGLAQTGARAVLLLTVIVTLLGGLGSGLARLGWQMDPASTNWILNHGPLMICGFLGTLISLERAVALASRYRWSLAAPVVSALGAAALLAAPQSDAGKVLLTAGSAGLVTLCLAMVRLHPSRDVVIMTAGAAYWLAGNMLWLAGHYVFQVVHLWTAFLILTIVGERLELSRVRRLSRASERLLVLAAANYGIGAAVTVIDLDSGIRLLGTGALMMAVWLFRFDIARRTVRQSGLPRYIAMCLLLGYGWLGVGGAIGIWKGALYAGPEYAAMLHAMLLGFVFSMIFGHAPIILPALTRLKLDYSPIFYGHLALLHVTLVYRMYGHLALDVTAQRNGGMLNVMAVLLFMAVTAVSVVRSNWGRGEGAAPTPPQRVGTL